MIDVTKHSKEARMKFWNNTIKTDKGDKLWTNDKKTGFPILENHQDAETPSIR